MYSFRQYLQTLEDPHGLTRRLGEASLCRDDRGRAIYSTGNSAAVFRIRCQGRTCALRCYFRPMRRLAAIYGDRYLPRELYLYTTPEQGQWVDAVLCDWVEGETLHAPSPGPPNRATANVWLNSPKRSTGWRWNW